MKEGEHQHTRLFKEVFKFDHSYKLCKGEYTLSNNIVHLKYDIHDDFQNNVKKEFLVFNFIFIGPESDHWLCLSVTPSENWLLFNKLDACEWCQLLDDACSSESVLSTIDKWCQTLLKSCVDKILAKISASQFGQEEGCWYLVQILKFMLGLDSEDEIWSRFL